MPRAPQPTPDFPVSTGLEGLVMPSNAPSSPASAPHASRDTPVNIPVQDIMELRPEVHAQVQAALRAPNRTSPVESTHEYNERVKREFTEKVLEMRHQAAAPPPPPQPVAPAMVDRTRREMEAGRKQSAYWAEQQKSRPTPNARDIAAAGTTVPVFQPAHYVHEKGQGFDGKNYTREDTSVR